MESTTDSTFNAYQYEDLLARSQDLYANTKYEIILKYLSGHQGLSILNAGCGSGELCLLLARAGHRVVGIDPAPEYIQLARVNARRCGADNCTFQVCSIEKMSAPDPFDCVMATDVLEHIEDDRQAFEKMVQLVKPGGLIVITVPAGQWLFGYHDESLGHYRRYSRRTLRQLVSDRCQVEKIRYFGFTLIPVCCLYSKLLRKAYPVGKAGAAGKLSPGALVLRSLLRVDRYLPMPFGTSLLLMGRRKEEEGSVQVRHRKVA
jgi:SAM-dependent methyltransferase